MDEPHQEAYRMRCTVCGDPCHAKHCGTLKGSLPGGHEGQSDHYLVHLCQGCFLGALSFLRQERRIMNLFYNEPGADDEFGLVTEPQDQPRP